ncbi:MAG TPA: arylamine N-acetyltransferase [Tianweitania sediminis]|jgi:N-hydroxyarylamine O-acetyltransferase|nr:arylamine N-acetyltransferase [Tianweitania sediminis]
MTAFDAMRYLQRLGLEQAPVRVEGLRTLQAAHMAAVPFENLDPLLGRVPLLDPAALGNKIVRQRRGGYCFELNALFGLALETFGYRPTTVLGRVRNGASQGGARMHQCFVVQVEGREWLADVGFGGPGAVWPVALDQDTPQVLPNGTYRVRFDASCDETVLERAQGEGWLALYGFDRSPVRPVDLEAANHLAATWKGAPFSTHLMMARHGEEGRTTLFNRKFTDGSKAQHVLASAEELHDVLVRGFGLDLPEQTATAVWDRIKDAPLER